MAVKPMLGAGNWSDQALKVLNERYTQNKPDGVRETPEEMCWRVAWAIAQAETRWTKAPERVQTLAEQFCAIMVERLFLPNSPTLMNAGTGSSLQYSACYVLPVDDSIEGIFEAIKRAAIVHQSGGGTGFSFSRLRPRGSPVRTGGGVASGPVSFMRAFDAATETIKQGGRRRGANMGILRVDHPDIVEFVACKLDGGMTNFNISVAATDRFMQALLKDEEYELVAPHSGEVVGKLGAKKVFDRIVQAAWQTGDPGMVFIDRINQSPANPTPELGLVEATNPCVTADAWVLTAEGPRQVVELAGKPCRLVVNGQVWNTGPQGFFPTGIKPVLRLRTQEGHALRLTANHLVARVVRRTRWMLEVEWAKVETLRAGDEIILHNHRGLESWNGVHTEEEGYLIGLLLGDGTLKEDAAVLCAWGLRSGAETLLVEAEQCVRTLPHRADFAGRHPVAGRDEWRMKSAALRDLALSLDMPIGHKTLTPAIERTSSDFYRGFLRGLFDTDGSVQGSQEKGVSVRLSQSDRGVLEGVQRMLLRLGINSHIYLRREVGESLLPDGRGGQRRYPTREQYELVISNDNVAVFAERVGFADSQKQAALDRLLDSYKRALNRERFVVRVLAIEPDGVEQVYDVCVPGVNVFDANGMYVHNCGEQPLLPNEACNLGSINLARFARRSNGMGEIAWNELESTVRLSVRFLDDVIEVNPYPLPEIKEQVRENRRIGLGIMGWADLLFELGIAYDSEEALALADQVMGFIRRIGHDESARLAQERGPFPRWPQSIYKNDRPLRNATVTTIAPTGTLSILAGTSSGIEPVFALAYSHIVTQPDGTRRHLQFVNPVFERIAKERGLYSESFMAEVAKRGNVRGLATVPEDVQRVFVTAHEISPEWHVRMQAAFQKHTDNGVSKTINLPNSATVNDVANAYLLAYELGCLGITVFRDGCKADQVLHVGTKSEKQSLSQSMPSIKPRPQRVNGSTYRIETPVGTAFITINNNGDGEPFEVFVNVGKAGSDVAADAEALGRLISLTLRSCHDPRRTAEEIVGQLSGIGGGRSLGFGNKRVRSLPDAIAQVLAQDIGLAQVPAPEPSPRQLPLPHPVGDLCPECGQATFVDEEGCRKCYACGFSEC